MAVRLLDVDVGRLSAIVAVSDCWLGEDGPRRLFVTRKIVPEGYIVQLVVLWLCITLGWAARMARRDDA